MFEMGFSKEGFHPANFQEVKMPRIRSKAHKAIKGELFMKKSLNSVKYSVCLQITGILISGVGTTIKAIYNNFDTLLEDRFYSPATLLIAIGCIVFLVAFFGCCGAVRESTCMVMIVSIPHHKNIFSLFHISPLVNQLQRALPMVHYT
jgi:hypothetical protein